MRWAHVARKDFADASRAKMLWVLTALMIVAVVGISAIPKLLYIPGEGGPAPDFEVAISYLFTTMTVMVSIIGLVVGYQAIVKERETGSIRFLLGLPFTRLDVLLGKAVGRAAVVAVPTVVGFAIGGAVIFVLYDGFVLTTYLGLLAFSILMGLVYVTLAVGVSASVSTRAKAVTGVLGIYVLFDLLWWAVPMAIYWLLERELPGTHDLPTWYVFVERLGVWNPLEVISGTMVDIAGVETISTADRIAGEVPFYLETWFAWVFIAAWIVVPLAIGYYRFKRAVIS
ncbi:ABC transporter permease [Halobacteria archaeon AArc-m2/3/4]|uniref:ABC transporter permease n=1 Tax=Natronoglomus mannanivorans TaxID=2979990 RepID=A0ABT2QGA9_9EURY|nr:ABC transporter permease [Halobacteria archaeon AArc-m2/3/4]